MRLFLFSISLLFFLELSGQTCCSGGVPVAANLGLPPTSEKTIQFRLSHDLNVLKTLKTGSETLDDDSRTRRTHSTIAEVGYSFTDRFSVDGFFSWVRQERIIEQFGNRNETNTNGVGDAVLLAKYRLWGNENQRSAFSTGLGVKFPLGATNRTGQAGLPVIADLQPGSGAWDGIFWNQFTTNFGSRPTTAFSALTVFSRKGKNEEYLGSQVYQFGDELQVAAIFSDRVLLGSAIIDPSFEVRYRKAWEDTQNDVTLPSTGGQWVFISPALSWWPNPDWSVNTSVTLPVFSEVEGTQLTPTYRVTVGVFRRIKI